MQARLYVIMRCLSVCLSVTFVNSVKTNKRSIKFFSLSGSHTILVFRAKRHRNIPTETPVMGASNEGGVGRNRDSEPISGLTACVTLQQARCCKHGHRWTTANISQVDITLVVGLSGGIDCGRRRRNVYDKKPQRYAKDNRTAHLTARSDKSVTYVTNNKRLLDVLYC